jgi:phage terminase large subunit-like protein
MKGKKLPRIFTPPLRELTPETSLGYMFIEFCESLGQPLLPWQQWLSIHALEITGEFPEDWNFRFRYIVVLVSRQNGKTYWFKLLGLFFNYVLQTKLVIGTAQNLDKANDTFEEAVELIEQTPELEEEFVKALRGAGKREYILKGGERWKVVATNRRARGWSSDLILADELREQTDWEGWSAISKTMLARPSAILVAVSNAGDVNSVVLRHLRMQAHAQLGDPDGVAAKREDLGSEDVDDALGLFEWSAPPGCDIHDKEAWAAANPSMGYGFLTEKALASACATDPERVFRTECLCQWVESLLPEPFPTGAWDAGVDESSGIAPESELFFGIDLSQNRRWTSIAVAGLREDGQYHVEVVARQIGTEWALKWFEERQEKSQMNLAFQGRGCPAVGLAEQICSMKNINRMAIEGGDLTAGWGRFWDGIAASDPESRRGGRRIYHLPQPVLDAPAKTMQLRSLGGGVELPDRVKSPDDPSPLIACFLAYAAATQTAKKSETKIYESSYAGGASLIFV